MNLRRFNNVLSVVVVVLGLYIALAPFLPQIAYWFRDKSPAVVAPYGGELAKAAGSDSDAPLPDSNRLVIPAIGIDEEVRESNSIDVIHNGGTWRRPATSTPDAGGNTVIVGHRFYGSDTSTFYHLDKLRIGDRMAVYWEKQEYVYEVSDVYTVDATALEIEAPTSTDQLTIYTCTPIWTAKNRLVVIAKQIVIDDESEATNE